MSKTHPDRESPPVTPRWVKVFGIIFIFLVLLVIILHLMGFEFAGHGQASLSSAIQSILQGMQVS